MNIGSFTSTREEQKKKKAANSLRICEFWSIEIDCKLKKRGSENFISKTMAENKVGIVYNCSILILYESVTIDTNSSISRLIFAQHIQSRQRTNKKITQSISSFSRSYDILLTLKKKVAFETQVDFTKSKFMTCLTYS